MALRTIEKGARNPEVRRAVIRILNETPLCSMATRDARGRPHINTAYFAADTDLSLVFLSDDRALHARNTARNPAMAVAVFRTAQRWGGSDRGLQLFGRCTSVAPGEAKTAERVYAARFPLFDRWIAGTTPRERRLAAELRRYQFYRFRPRRIKLFDEAEFPGLLIRIAL